MADLLPQEALVRVFHFLPIRDRSRLAGVSKAWQLASVVDAVSVKLTDSHVPHYLHVALPDGAAQLQAAACPMMSLARSADLTWASHATTGSLLQSMPSLERLAFTSMTSGSLPTDSGGGLRSLKSLTNLLSLQLSTSDAAPLLEAMPSAPRTLRRLELHLAGDAGQSSVLQEIATHLGEQAAQLRSLLLRCSHASVFAATQPMESLSRLTGLTSLRMGPNPEDVSQHRSPLGFGRLPSFISALSGLQHLDIAMADSPAPASLSSLDFTPLRAIPDVKLTLRADTSCRAVAHLPRSLSSVAGLSSLTVQGFSFEDPGGWCTTAVFDVAPLVGCPRLTALELQLGTWECEHCEAFELVSLQQLTQLHSLRVCIAAASSSHAASGGGSSGSGSRDDGAAMPEVLLALPLMRPAQQLLIASSMRVVLRNSKVLARAHTPGLLAHSIVLEEPLPAKRDAPGGKGSDVPAAPRRDQGPQQAADSVAHQKHVRAAAHVVISALRDLWPEMEVWQYPMQLPSLRPGGAWRQASPELCCRADARDDMQVQLRDLLLAGIGCT